MFTSQVGKIIAIAVFVVLWAVKIRYSTSPEFSDIAGFFALLLLKIFLVRPKAFSVAALQRAWQYPIVYQSAILSLLLYASWFTYRSFTKEVEEKAVENGLCDERTATDHPLKPMLFPCRTSHTRIFPKKHSFSYSYLFVGIPIGRRGFENGIISADPRLLTRHEGKMKRAWFSVDSADYLRRGDSQRGLYGKLDDYLRSQVGLAAKIFLHRIETFTE